MVNKTNLTQFGIVKGLVVEVRNDQKPFNDAWYRAFLEQITSESGSGKFLVRYLTLFGDDGLTPLKGTVYSNSIRPLPPREMVVVENFEEGDVVDAGYRDGWWAGVVRKIQENGRYLVYFNNPPDIIEFEGKDLRPSLHWINGKWVRTEKEPPTNSRFQSRTTVELKLENVQGLNTVWVPAVVIKENRDGTIYVKYKTLIGGDDAESKRITVGSSRVRLMSVHCIDRDFGLMDLVDVRQEFGWREGEITRVLPGKRYTVSFKCAAEKVCDFNHSDLRPSLILKDGTWVLKSKPLLTYQKKNLKNAEDTQNNTEERSPCPPSKTNLRDLPFPVSDVSSAKGAQNETVLLARLRLFAQMARSRKNTLKPETNGDNGADPAPNGNTTEAATTSKETEGKGQGKAKRNQNNSVIDSSEEKAVEKKSSVQKRKRSRPRQFINPTGLSWDRACPEPDSSFDLPFEKRSPVWNTFESMEAFKVMPQRPHFRPLLETDEDYREGSAVGLMVTFSGLFDKVKHLQIEEPMSTLERIKECLLNVEKHGFDITRPLGRLDELLSIKDRRAKTVEELQKLKREIESSCNKRKKCEDDTQAITRKIVELRCQRAAMVRVKETVEKEMARLQTEAATLDQTIQDIEHNFLKTVTSPWKQQFEPRV